MHHLIQRGKVRSQVINVPEGLPELLSDITREVLRCQPTTECLCQFIIDYLHSIIVTRDKARIAKSIIDRALRVVDDVIANMCICDIPQAKAESMCEVMEECFRRFLNQRRCEKAKEKEIVKYNEFDMLDELVMKCKFTDEEIKISKPVIEEAYQKFVNAYMMAKESSEGTDSLYQYFREREIKRMEERLKIEAAIKIQSNFRGYMVRKSMFIDGPAHPPAPLADEYEQDQNQLEIAARKIQQFFRRHISDVKIEADEKFQQLQDPCSPASNLSLNARPAHHHDIDYSDQHKEKQDDSNHIEPDHMKTQRNDHSIGIEPIKNNIDENVTDERVTEVKNENGSKEEIQGS